MSSTIGVAFFLVVMVVGLNFTFYALAQEYALSSSLTSAEKATLDKKGEALQLLDLRVGLSDSKLNITVFNAGSRTVHIVRLWVTNQTNPPLHRSYGVSIWVDVGQIVAGLGSTIGAVNPLFPFTIQLVTQRGNVFSAKYAPDFSVLATAQGSGWLTVDWMLYNYTVSDGGTESVPDGAWCIKSLGGTQTFQFFTRVINHWDRDVTLLSLSYLVFFSTSGGSQAFFIMGSTSTAKNPAGYSDSNPIPVQANPSDQQTGGPPMIMKFLADAPGGTQQRNNNLNGGSFAAFIVLFYKDPSGNTLSQAIPFQASEVTSAPNCD